MESKPQLDTPEAKFTLNDLIRLMEDSETIAELNEKLRVQNNERETLFEQAQVLRKNEA